jgi:hypothetical protein
MMMTFQNRIPKKNEEQKFVENFLKISSASSIRVLPPAEQ